MFSQEKVQQFKKYNTVGNKVSVKFNVSTNEWQGKYFTSLQAWKVFKADDNTPSPAIAVAQDLAGDDDGLPF